MKFDFYGVMLRMLLLCLVISQYTALVRNEIPVPIRLPLLGLAVWAVLFYPLQIDDAEKEDTNG